MQSMQIRPFKPDDENAVVELWNRCGLLRPWNDPRRDIARKLRVQPEWFLVGTIDEKIVATVMAGFDGHRGWVNYLAVDPSFQRRGLGRRIMTEAERLLHGFGCPKINLQIRRDNQQAIDFYERIGFSEDAVVSYGKRLIPDD
jgi:ribosomal protein S18 acetylase RimI-like enzyme